MSFPHLIQFTTQKCLENNLYALPIHHCQLEMSVYCPITHNIGTANNCKELASNVHVFKENINKDDIGLDQGPTRVNCLFKKKKIQNVFSIGKLLLSGLSLPCSVCPCQCKGQCSKWGSVHCTGEKRSSERADGAGLQAVLVARRALEGLEVVREAVAVDGHLAAMAHGARDEVVAPAGLARLWELHSLWRETERETDPALPIGRLSNCLLFPKSALVGPQTVSLIIVIYYQT